MNILRDEHQAALADLHAGGEELLQRFEAAAALDGLSAPAREAIEHILGEQRTLLSDLSELMQTHDDLPTAGNQERAELESAADRLRRAMEQESSLLQRLVTAEEGWLEDITQASAMSWPAREDALLKRLAQHSRQAIQTLATQL